MSSLLPPCHVSLWLPPPSFTTRKSSFTTTPLRKSPTTTHKTHHDTITVVTAPKHSVQVAAGQRQQDDGDNIDNANNINTDNECRWQQVPATNDKATPT
ncbi:hypothetical protein EDB84DRAFT_1557484 [Lactarius hengduanensis]|nr:hypothetical protein EDB84DRAFT_1557484 [Lactarius hengduanensis]